MVAEIVVRDSYSGRRCLDGNNLRAKYPTFKILELFACVDFAEIAEVVQTDEFGGGGLHSLDVEVTRCWAGALDV